MPTRERRPALIERFPYPVRLPQPNFDDTRRSGWLEWFCARLERILVARAAADLIVPRPGVDHRGAAVVGVGHPPQGRLRRADPGCLVAEPGGRGARRRDLDPPLGHSRPRPHRRRRHLCHRRPTLERADQCKRQPSPSRGQLRFPHAVTAPVMPASRARRVLASLVADGEAARWEAITALEPKALEAVRRAHAEVVAEVGPAADGTCMLLDRLDVQALADRMLLGDVDTTSPSPVARLIERCLSPSAFARVDPRRYVTSALRVYATEEIRRAIGDPHVGPKVRAAAAALGTTDVDAVIAYYQARRPADRLGRRRAEAALDILRRATGPPVPFAAPEAS